MQYRTLLTSLVFVFALCLFSANAFAEGTDEGGIDLRLGIGSEFLWNSYDITMSGGGITVNESTDNIHYNGVMGKIAIGYRWNFGGIYFEQDLGGLWLDNDEARSKDADFLGGSFIVGRFIIPATSALQFEIGAGLGVMYGADKNPSDSSYRPSLIVDGEGNPSRAFAVKIALGLSYYFTPIFGLGIYCDYNYAFKLYESSETISGITVNADVTAHYHVLSPGLQLLFKF